MRTPWAHEFSLFYYYHFICFLVSEGTKCIESPPIPGTPKRNGIGQVNLSGEEAEQIFWKSLNQLFQFLIICSWPMYSQFSPKSLNGTERCWSLSSRKFWSFIFSKPIGSIVWAKNQFSSKATRKRGEREEKPESWRPTIWCWIPSIPFKKEIN